MYKIAIGIIIGMLSGMAQATTLTVDKKRTVNISGEIGFGIVSTATTLLRFKGKDPVYIVINSPGGDIDGGLQVVTAIKVLQQRGTPVKCVVSTLAASMAFQILAECSERYVFTNSLLLWHPPRMFVNVGITPSIARTILRQLAIYEKVLVEPLVKALGIDRAIFLRHYHAETTHIGSSLNKLAPGFLTIIDDLVGAGDFLKMKQPEVNFFMEKRNERWSTDKL